MNHTPASESSGEVDEDDSIAVAASPRHDHKPTGVKPKGKRGRPPKVRHDSPEALPINGWGEPFEVALQPGWAGFWASDHDLSGMSFRPWKMATWGDPRVLSYSGAAEGKKGEAIKYRELTLMLMSSAHAEAIQVNDKRRMRHQQLRTALKLEAEKSGDARHGGKFIEHQLG